MLGPAHTPQLHPASPRPSYTHNAARWRGRGFFGAKSSEPAQAVSSFHPQCSQSLLDEVMARCSSVQLHARAHSACQSQLRRFSSQERVCDGLWNTQRSWASLLEVPPGTGPLPEQMWGQPSRRTRRGLCREL